MLPPTCRRLVYVWGSGFARSSLATPGINGCLKARCAAPQTWEPAVGRRPDGTALQAAMYHTVHRTSLPCWLAVGKRPDEKALQAVLAEVWRLLQTPGLDPAAARASFYLAAAAARANPAVRKQLAAQVREGLLRGVHRALLPCTDGPVQVKSAVHQQRLAFFATLVQVAAAISAADEAANAAGPLGKSPRRSAATDWDLQHTAFATTRLAGSATGSDEISRSFGVGVGSGDPVGARHALALGGDVALRVRALLGIPAVGFVAATLRLALQNHGLTDVLFIGRCTHTGHVPPWHGPAGVPSQHIPKLCTCCRMPATWCGRCTKL